MVAHPDIGKKKRILENLILEFEDFRSKNKLCEFVHYTLFKIDHKKFPNTHTWDKWCAKLEDNIVDDISTNLLIGILYYCVIFGLTRKVAMVIIIRGNKNTLFKLIVSMQYIN